MESLEILEKDGGVSFRVRLHPRAGCDRISGVVNGQLRVDVRAPPVKNKANRSLIKILGKAIGVPQHSVTITRGATGRDKVIAIRDLGAAELRSCLTRFIHTSGQ
ncbi:MAG: DUF167 domain-containing protein [PVC group bacterium]